jgi:hypothetical protein
LAAKSKENLVALGFPQFTVEDFHDIVSETGGCDDAGGGSGDDDGGGSGDDASEAP